MASPRSNARLVRFGIFAFVLIFCGYVLTKGSTYSSVPPAAAPVTENSAAGAPAAAAPAAAAPAAAAPPAAAPAAQQANKQAPAAASGDKVKATFVTLARNLDINAIVGSIRHIQDRFNKNYNYDWVFLNDEEFNEDFIKATSNLVTGQAKYGLIPKEHWSYPDWIDKEKAALAREEMVAKKVIYGGSESYRHMCRFESGFFWRHPLLDEYEYYWRVEPDIKIYCDIDYDIFKFMKDNNKMYGFTISLPEYKLTIPTLWETTKEFTKANPQYLAENNNMKWISDDNGETYNGCHFWSNFEVASLKLWRSEAYQKYFEHLDKAGGFFYERWGDAPVHSIAASLFIPKDQIHFFDDVGYYHVPFHNCPINEETRAKKNCVCSTKEDFTWKAYSCTPKFFSVNGLTRPKGWENFTQ